MEHNMSRIMIIAGLATSLVRFRGELIDHWLQLGHLVCALAPDVKTESILAEKGVICLDLSFKRTGLNPIRDLGLLIKLIYLYRKFKPDYLFLYTIKPVIYGSIASVFYPFCRVFSMITGLGFVFTEVEGSRKWLRNAIIKMYRIALKRNQKVFFQNQDDLKEFVELKIVEKDKTAIINGSGVNLAYYKPVDLPVGEIVFLMIARLLKEKGFVEYVEAAKKIKEKYTEVNFKMIAWQLEGGPSVIPADQVESWQDEGIVEIFGETDDVRPYLASASVYVLPSYREGTPRTVLEAMAMGRAIITTDTPGCRETVVEGMNGFLIPVRDSIALAAAMERFILEPDLITKMGKASRSIAEENYDVHRVNQVINRTMGLL
jgi:glycosyltransferase involved in cell wall biosynthesis